MRSTKFYQHILKLCKILRVSTHTMNLHQRAQHCFNEILQKKHAKQSRKFLINKISLDISVSVLYRSLLDFYFVSFVTRFRYSASTWTRWDRTSSACVGETPEPRLGRGMSRTDIMNTSPVKTCIQRAVSTITAWSERFQKRLCLILPNFLFFQLVLCKRIDDT